MIKAALGEGDGDGAGVTSAEGDGEGDSDGEGEGAASLVILNLTFGSVVSVMTAPFASTNSTFGIKAALG